MYFIVLLRETSSDDGVDHERFVDTLIEQNRILLGGEFGDQPVPGITAAYVLRCSNRREAEHIVAADPLVTSGCCVPIITSWELVGVNTAAIDSELLI